MTVWGEERYPVARIANGHVSDKLRPMDQITLDGIALPMYGIRDCRLERQGLGHFYLSIEWELGGLISDDTLSPSLAQGTPELQPSVTISPTLLDELVRTLTPKILERITFLENAHRGGRPKEDEA